MTASKGIGKGHRNIYFFGDIPIGGHRTYTWPDGADRDIYHRRVSRAAWMHGRKKRVSVMVRKVSIGVQVWRLR